MKGRGNTLYEKSLGALGSCLRATKKILPGTILLTFDPTCTIREQTYQTVQVGINQHILADSFFSLLNHSCDPNLIIDTKKGAVYALKNIDSREELNFFYPSTEWDMSSPFVCNCNKPECISYIGGAWWTPVNILASHYLNDHIVYLIKEKIDNASKLDRFRRR
ncbi:SET domain-containing protein-lysine N-methyltransferase [Natranaerofaba carboxydovora]|uniref:SET domain-containing protein-lysine N-methyltransferase n=1 Tax=Natranaerofaba carboxydovora TaxID=2742683 RepID=UPI001F13C575|nr:SET domain-containing protein-lysine N-methyltransferase [Natranaerofaba carboxydovora]